MSFKKITAAALGKLPYRGWQVNFLKDEKTIRITDGKQTHDFKGKSVTREYHQGEALAAAHKWIHEYENTIQEGEIREFTMLCVMVKQAKDQALMVEDKFTKMDKQKLKQFLNACNGITRSLEIRMDNGPEEFENSTYAILEYMEDVNKTALDALLSGKGDDFQALINVYKSGKYEFKEKSKAS